ncbi:unnamed protein product, partial [Porites lobata]
DDFDDDDDDTHKVTHENRDGDFDGHHGDDVDGWSVTDFAKADDNGEGNDVRELKQSRLQWLRTH